MATAPVSDMPQTVKLWCPLVLKSNKIVIGLPVLCPILHGYEPLRKDILLLSDLSFLVPKWCEVAHHEMHRSRSSFAGSTGSKKIESHKVNVHHVITKLSHSVQKQRNEPHSLIYNGDIVAEMSNLNTTILNRLQGRVERQQRWI
jgi:hypothetical protein